jgi:hypothetical protein
MTGRRRILLVTALALGGVAAWISIDLNNHTRHDLRRFDPREVARLETGMWRSYYGHERVRLFTGLIDLLRRQYHLPFWRASAGALHAARAAVVFQRGHNRPDYMKALPDLVSFYRLIRGNSNTAFDVNKAAALELEWWIIHRERARHNPKDLVNALAELQAEIYQQPVFTFEEHAKARADAMLIRDKRAQAGGVSEADWNRIGALLERSWISLATVVSARNSI